MKLHCPECGHEIPAEDIDLSTALAKCRNCNAVFNFKSSMPVESRHPPAGPAAAPLLPKSDRIRIEEFAGVLRIRYRWFTPVYIFLTFFCIAWDSFLIFWYSAALGKGHGGFQWVMVIFPIAHVAVGVGLTYLTIAGFVNSTTLDIGQGQLTVRHRPLPWRGNRTLATDQIVQLHVEEKRANNKSGTSYTYDLFATLTGGQKLRLLAGFTDPGEPRLIERRIEDHLHIPPRPVVGEYAR